MAKPKVSKAQAIKKKEQQLSTSIKYDAAFTKKAANSTGLQQKFWTAAANEANKMATKNFDELLYMKHPALKPTK